jgi:CHAD domain-containing protein
LAGATPGLDEGPTVEERLEADYHDTPSLALLRSDVTLRWRDNEAGWTVKLPLTARNANGTELTRREVTFGGSRRRVAPGAADLVTALRRGESLVRVATITTIRRRRALLVDGTVVATLCDDAVEATRADGTAFQFREIEVELADGASAIAATLLPSIGERLAPLRQPARAAPKLARVLGDHLRPPDVVEPSLKRSATLEDLVRTSLARSVVGLVNHDPGVRLGEAHSVHQLRVAARRLRSDLRTLTPVLDPEWVDELRGELRWLGSEVGPVRDRDVMLMRLRGRIDHLPEADRAATAPLLARLADERVAADAELHVAMGSDRYVQLLEALVGAANYPCFATGATTAAPARTVVRELVRRPWRRLRRAAVALGPDPTDTELHEVRILAKRCRYAAEMAGIVAGKEMRGFAAVVEAVQGVLGDHQDTVVAEAWLRAAASELPASAFAAGVLVREEQEERIEHRLAWPQVWAAVSPAAARAGLPW